MILSVSWSGAGAGLGEQPVGIALTASSRSAGAAAGRALQPREVLLESERPPVVDADHLERAVAADQPLVGDRNRRLGGEHDVPVERGQRAGTRSRHAREPTSPRVGRPIPRPADDRRRRGGHVVDRGPFAHGVESCPPVKILGVGRPISLSREPSVPPRIAVRSARVPRPDRRHRGFGHVRNRSGTRPCCGTAGARRDRCRTGPAPNVRAVRCSSSRWSCSSGSSKSRTISRSCASPAVAVSS